MTSMPPKPHIALLDMAMSREMTGNIDRWILLQTSDVSMHLCVKKRNLCVSSVSLANALTTRTPDSESFSMEFRSAFLFHCFVKEFHSLGRANRKISTIIGTGIKTISVSFAFIPKSSTVSPMKLSEFITRFGTPSMKNCRTFAASLLTWWTRRPVGFLLKYDSDIV